MGQQDIINALRKLGGTGTNREIQELVNVHPQTVCRVLRKLRDQGVVRRIGDGLHELREGGTAGCD